MAFTMRPEIVPAADFAQAASQALADADDVHLVRCTLRGQDEAYDLLVKRHTPLVVGFLYARTGNAADTEDIAQEAFFAAYRGLGRLRNPECFAGWLMSIARTKLIDHCRKQSRQPFIVDPGGSPADIALDPLERAKAPTPDPARLASLHQTRAIVMREIDGLSERYRTVLYWRLLGEESTAEIARRLNLRENTVRMRLFRGLKLLRKALRRQGITAFPEK